jgi:Fur family transcriptional regulator, stress-responsive regulator
MDDPATDASRLRKLGLRATGPRLALLTVLERVGGHRSADELVAELRQAGYPHARTTVYNALDDLTRAGLIHAAPVAAGALRYEADLSPHQHFVCSRCGLIVNVAAVFDPVEGPAPSVQGARIDLVDVVYRGRCADCLAAEREPRLGPEQDAEDPHRHPHEHTGIGHVAATGSSAGLG